MKCGSCGEEAPDWAASCPHCGAALAGASSGGDQGAWGGQPQGAWGEQQQGAWGEQAPGGWAPPPPPQGGWPPPGGYGQDPYGQAPYGQAPYGQGPYGQGPYGYRPGTGYAGYLYRVGATLVDGLLLGLISTGLRAAGGSTGAVLGVLVGVAYQTILLGQGRGQTLGNMALGTRVVDENTGQPIGYARAFVHYIVEVVLFAVFIVPGILDILWPLWDRRNQTLHDKVARSVVVRT